MGDYDIAGRRLCSAIHFGPVLRRKAGLALGLAFSTTVSVTSAQEAPEAREIAPNEWRSQRDNPWQVLPDFSVLLSAIEEAERTPVPVNASDPTSVSATWNFEMELWTAASGADPFSPTSPRPANVHTTSSQCPVSTAPGWRCPSRPTASSSGTNRRDFGGERALRLRAPSQTQLG